MKQVIYFSVIILMLCTACATPGPDKQEELTPAEMLLRDSISRTEQKRKSDSLKRLDPMLILPPDSMYTGDYTDKYTEGGITKFKGFFRFGQRHGQWMSFYPNGLLWSEMHYDKGLREGPNLTYLPDGKPRYSGFYKNDRKDSTWMFYDSLGVLEETVIYKADHIVKRTLAK